MESSFIPQRTEVEAQDGSFESFEFFPREGHKRGAPYLEAAPVLFTGFEVSFSATSAALAAKVGVSAIYDGHIEVDTKALFFDALLTTDYYEEVTQGDEVLFAKKKGTGLRVALRATGLSANMSLNFAAVAAEASFKGAAVSYQVQGVALSDVVLKSFLSIPLRGELNPDVFAAIQRSISDALPKYLRSGNVGVGEYPVFPTLARKCDPSSRARAVYFALQQISRGSSLSKALSQAGTRFDHEIIVIVYARVASVSDTNSTAAPSQETTQRASLWLSQGIPPV